MDSAGFHFGWDKVGRSSLGHSRGVIPLDGRSLCTGVPDNFAETCSYVKVSGLKGTFSRLTLPAHRGFTTCHFLVIGEFRLVVTTLDTPVGIDLNPVLEAISASDTEKGCSQ